MASTNAPQPQRTMAVQCFAQTQEMPSSSPEARLREAHYRRGYLHGYSKAMDDLKAGCRRTVWNRVCAFFNDTLTPWRYRNDGHRTPPPAYGHVPKREAGHE